MDYENDIGIKIPDEGNKLYVNDDYFHIKPTHTQSGVFLSYKFITHVNIYKSFVSRIVLQRKGEDKGLKFTFFKLVGFESLEFPIIRDTKLNPIIE